MSQEPDYYRVLQVQPDAHEAVIRASYRALMQVLRLHPDLGGDADRAALLNRAMAVLGDADARRRYDASQSRRGAWTRAAARCPFCAAPELPGREACPRCGAPGPEACAGLTALARDGDARRLARIRHAAPVEILRRWPQPVPDRGVVVDLSFSGMRLRTDAACAADDRLLLRLSALQALARVLAVSECPTSRELELRVVFERTRLRRRRGGFVRVQA